MNRVIQTNDEPTTATLAAALAGFRNYLRGEEEALRRGWEALPQLSGTPLEILSNTCLDLESRIKNEKSEMSSYVDSILQEALKHVLGHYAAVDPASLNTIKEMWPSGDPLVPQRLVLERLEHHEAVVAITWNFLVEMGYYPDGEVISPLGDVSSL